MLEGALAFAVNLVRRRTTAADRLARTIDDAYDRYYRHNINAATLDAYIRRRNA